MAITTGLKIEGVEDVEKALLAIGVKVAQKVVKTAVRKGSKIILKKARDLVPVDTGALKKSLGIKRKIYRRSGVMVDIVGPRKGFEKTGPDGKTRNPVNYAHLVEMGGVVRGASIKGRKGTGKLLGNRRANSFLRKAFDENNFRALRAIEREASVGIQRAAREVKT